MLKLYYKFNFATEPDGKSKNTDNQYNFIHIYNTSSINVLVSNDFYSLSAYPKEEVIKYITDWDKISLPAILLVLLFVIIPIFIFPFVGKRRRKTILQKM